jgi:predicted MFS family arabinose efflux permease
MALVSSILYRERPPEAAVESAPKPSPGSAPKTPPKQKGGLRAVLSRPELILTMIVMPLLAGGQMGFAAHWTLYLVEDAGLTKELAGICLTVGLVVGAVARPGWGLVSDRVLHGDRMKTLPIICGVGFLGSIGAAGLLSLGAPVWLAFVVAVFMCAGFFGFHGALIALVAETAGAELAGSAMGIVITVSWMGIVAVPIVYGVISDHWSYTWCWVLSVIFAAIGVIVYSVFLIRQRTRNILPKA